jgi:hypothetical protein
MKKQSRFAAFGELSTPLVADAALRRKIAFRIAPPGIKPVVPGARIAGDVLVIDEAKAAGVYVFGGGIDEAVPPVLVSADGTFSAGGYSWAPPLNGGFTVLELPSREEAIAWAARIAKACRCHQELRVFGFDPAS